MELQQAAVDEPRSLNRRGPVLDDARTELPLIATFRMTTGWDSPSKAKTAPPAATAPVLVMTMLFPVTAVLLTVAGESISTAFPANEPSPPLTVSRLPLITASLSTSV